MNRKKIKWSLVGWGIFLQFIFALLILKTHFGYVIFEFARRAVTKLLDFTDIGASFLFGNLVSDRNIGAIVAFKVLPTIIFVSSLMGILYYLGVIQFIVRLFAKVMQKTMRISGAESLAAALFVFMGIETVTAIKAYINKMTQSELFTLMTAFMATIAGGVMAAYVSFGVEAGHLLAASIMSAPAAIVISKVMVPETEAPLTMGKIKMQIEKRDANIIDAAANGAGDGLKLSLTIGAMLLAFIALVGMINFLFGYLSTSFDQIIGWGFAPLAFIMGVPYQDCLEVGRLLGIKTVFNEFLAYIELKKFLESGGLDPRSVVIATYGLCSFANFGSVAILIGGIGGVASSQKTKAASLGLRALLAGLLAGFMTATIAGVLL
jgi:CNT family concentrative nucleoside transporter